MSSNEYMREYMKQYSAMRRQKAIDILGGKCTKCASRDNLEIHHIDPSTKLFSIGNGWHHVWKKILTELEKCILLCKDCHIKQHKSNHPHGTALKYWRGCRCNECTKANSKYNSEYKIKRAAGRSAYAPSS